MMVGGGCPDEECEQSENVHPLWSGIYFSVMRSLTTWPEHPLSTPLQSLPLKKTH